MLAAGTAERRHGGAAPRAALSGLCATRAVGVARNASIGVARSNDQVPTRIPDGAG